ncbi:hypothetical protein B0J14DRAFT_660183 [Halenospora varia]|nr:hypothetical protein B0J14DRAFT_660183 [Halenospora varia]
MRSPPPEEVVWLSQEDVAQQQSRQRDLSERLSGLLEHRIVRGNEDLSNEIHRQLSILEDLEEDVSGLASTIRVREGMAEIGYGTCEKFCDGEHERYCDFKEGLDKIERTIDLIAWYTNCPVGEFEVVVKKRGCHEPPVNQSQQEMDELNIKHDKMADDLRYANEKASRAERMIGELQEQPVTYREQVNTANTRVLDSQDITDSLRSELNIQKQIVRRNDIKFEAMDKQLDIARKEISRKKYKLIEQDNPFKSNQTQFEYTIERCREAEEQLQDRDKEISHLTEENTKLSADFTSLQQEKDRLRTKLDSLNATLEYFKKAMGGRQRNHDVELQNLRQVLKHNQDQHKDTKEKAREEITKLKDTVRSLQNDSVELVEKCQYLEELLDDAHRENLPLKEEIDRLKVDRNSIIDEVQRFSLLFPRSGPRGNQGGTNSLPRLQQARQTGRSVQQRSTTSSPRLLPSPFCALQTSGNLINPMPRESAFSSRVSKSPSPSASTHQSMPRTMTRPQSLRSIVGDGQLQRSSMNVDDATQEPTERPD